MSSRAEQAQKGFKTFILTLSISLMLFSAVYYALTNYSGTDVSVPDIESQDSVTEAVPNDTPETVFGTLADQKINDIPERAVLAATTSQSSQTSQGAGTTGTGGGATPEGGVVSITLGLLTSVLAFILGMYVIALDPRRLALKSFERKISQ